MENIDYKTFEKTQLTLAKNIRKKIAEEHSKKFLVSLDVENTKLKIQQSFFNELLQRNSFEKALESIAFSMFITEMAVDEILKSNLDLKIKISTIGYVAELGAKEFISPYNTKVLKKNLSSVKNRGYYFTPFSLAHKMAEESLKKSDIFSVLDPSCGIGTLLAASLLQNPNIERVVGIEIDYFTTNLAKKLLHHICESLNINPKIDIINCDYLDYISNLSNSKFDMIIMNPPYGQIKFLSSSLTDISTKSFLNDIELRKLAFEKVNSSKELSISLRKRFSSIGLGKGTPELSKIFLGSATQLLKNNGILIAITPSSWLGDLQGLGLRHYLLNNFNIKMVWNFREDAKLFNGVNQPTTVVVLCSGTGTTDILIKPNLSRLEALDKESYSVSLNKIKQINPKYLPIPQFGSKQLDILLKLHLQNKSVKDYSFIKNLRGELDLTKYKNLIKHDPSYDRLIRGDHIEAFYLKEVSESEKVGYVDAQPFKSQLGSSQKLQHINSRRLAIPQCTYLQQAKRIKACIVNENMILGNSCNYIYIDPNIKNSKKWLDFICIILNSSIIEWRFRIFNSNNHIANYEIDELPLVDMVQINPYILEFIFSIYSNGNAKNIDEFKFQLDALVYLMYNLNKDELLTICRDLNLAQTKINKIMNFYDEYKGTLFRVIDNELQNHIIPTLSKLDLEMIEHVPQGGNWTSIPESVPSQRVRQIREQSKERGMVRTTYYGRLNPEQPAYTIATSFNRPGNGTNIHPWENRTITAREAARLQSFPDDFIFYGSDGAIRTQIGNAVPPLLSYAVGKSFGPMTFVDLFAGAGGLSYGLELAGLTNIAALEQDKYAAETYRKNHAQTSRLIQGDITDKQVRKEFIAYVKESLKDKPLGLLAGGPPCQGFSTAGWRNPKDSRNVLVTYFLEIAEALKPQNILIENVEGILSYEKGNVVKSIKTVLNEIGYSVLDNPWVLNAEEYGVPQMRRRVFIVATLEPSVASNKLKVPKPYFDKCKGRRETEENKINPKLAYPITVKEALASLPPLKPQVYMNRDMNSLYDKWCQKEITAEEFLNARGSAIKPQLEKQLSLF